MTKAADKKVDIKQNDDSDEDNDVIKQSSDYEDDESNDERVNDDTDDK